MNTTYLLDGLLVIALVGFMLYRQMTWRPVDPGRLWRAPLILAIVGVITMVSSKTQALSALDLAVLAGELVISLLIGAAMGAIANFRPLSADARAAYEAKRAASSRGRVSTHPIIFESRTGWVGLILWVVLIGVRVGMEFAASGLGADAGVTSTGIILLVVAANRAARVAVFSYRLSRHPEAAPRLAPRA